jgi:hypothetical protein
VAAFDKAPLLKEAPQIGHNCSTATRHQAIVFDLKRSTSQILAQFAPDSRSVMRSQLWNGSRKPDYSAEHANGLKSPVALPRCLENRRCCHGHWRSRKLAAGSRASAARREARLHRSDSPVALKLASNRWHRLAYRAAPTRNSPRGAGGSRARFAIYFARQVGARRPPSSLSCAHRGKRHAIRHTLLSF